jgi:transposase
MRQTKRMLTDEQWGRIAPHLPRHTPSPQGGRPRCDDRLCLEGILWVLRNGGRWQSIPVDLPSGSTCWRRLHEWACDGVLERIHLILVEELHDLGKLDLSELLGDATFIRAKKGGDEVGNTKVGKGMKLEVVVDKSGLPLGLATAAASEPEAALLPEALKDVPVPVPPGTPVVADRGHDSDALRDRLEAAGHRPVIPHRRNRTRPSRNDGRRLRRYRHRWVVERTNAWLHTYRGLAVRWTQSIYHFIGLAYLTFIHLALQRF